MRLSKHIALAQQLNITRALSMNVSQEVFRNFPKSSRVYRKAISLVKVIDSIRSELDNDVRDPDVYYGGKK